MKLVIAIVQDEDSQELLDTLTEENFRVTKLATTGGFLKSGNTTFMIGVPKDDVPKVIRCIKQVCKSREETITAPSLLNSTSPIYMSQTIDVSVGGATIFVLDVDQFIRI